MPRLIPAMEEGAEMRRDLALAAALAAVALLVRVLFVIRALPVPDLNLERYLFIASSISSRDWSGAINYHYSPLFPFLIVIAHQLISNWEIAAAGVAVLVSALTVFPLFFLARDLFSRRAAFLAAAFFALRFFNLVPACGDDQVLIFLLTLAVWTGFRGLASGHSPWFFVAGFSFGAAFLAKPEAGGPFLLFMILTAGLGLRRWFREKRAGAAKKTGGPPASDVGLPGPAHSLFALALALSAYLFFAAPFLAVHYVNTNQLSGNPKLRALFIVHNFYDQGQLYNIEKDDRGAFTPAQRMYMEGDKRPIKLDLAAKLWNDRGDWLGTWLRRALASARKHLIGFYLQPILPWLWPLVWLAGLWPNRDRQKAEREAYLHLFALLTLLAVPFFSDAYPRFFMSLLPWFMIVLGHGLDRGLHALGRLAQKDGRVDRKLSEAVTAAVLLFWLIISAGLLIRNSPPDDKFFMELEFRRSIAETLKSRLAENCRFMAAPEPGDLWYLMELPPAREVILPVSSLNQAVNYAEQTDAKFIVFHDGEITARYPAILPLLKEDFDSPRLKRIFREPSPAGLTYVIYQVTTVPCGL